MGTIWILHAVDAKQVLFKWFWCPNSASNMKKTPQFISKNNISPYNLERIKYGFILLGS